ncbi:hypothetical protein GCM10009662_43920 [Catellatospora coxensis]|uniref:Uncharacterized protein n=1 Tax=Catellatospora coxensis TaxID=310354 RepID=A0A8J3P6L8_9ACTN|nr:hypothetical protein Cco03nite_23740 [Catellatospora coxensis]
MLDHSAAVPVLDDGDICPNRVEIRAFRDLNRQLRDMMVTFPSDDQTGSFDSFDLSEELLMVRHLLRAEEFTTDSFG